MNPREESWSRLAKGIIKGLEKRNMEGYYCETGREALKLALSMVKPGSSAAWGGSETLNQLGIQEALKARDDIEILDRDAVKSPEEKYDVQVRSFGVDHYFMSSNAITKDGVLVNIDGSGNRAACLVYGPKSVVMLVGMNKVVTDAEAGIVRARNVAAPANTVRLGVKTPCAEVGYCMDCQAPGCICGDIVITRHTLIEKRIKVILIGEELGY